MKGYSEDDEPTVSTTELYTVTVLKETASTGADIDGDVLLYLEMAQVRGLDCPSTLSFVPLKKVNLIC